MAYGKFDLDKIIESLTKIHISTEWTTLGIREQGIYAVEQMLLAKYHMNAQVYKHRIRRITDAMLIRGIEYAIKESDEIKSIFIPKDADDFLEEYVKYDDKTLKDMILRECKGTSFKYFERLQKRRLFKEILGVGIDKNNFQDIVLLDNVRKLTEGQMKEIAERSAELFSRTEEDIDSMLVIVDKQTTLNPTFKPPQESINVDTIMVETREGYRHNFTTSSDVFSNPTIEPEKDKLYIYLPLDKIDKREKRRECIKSKKATLLEIIKEVTS